MLTLNLHCYQVIEHMMNSRRIQLRCSRSWTRKFPNQPKPMNEARFRDETWISVIQKSPYCSKIIHWEQRALRGIDPIQIPFRKQNVIDRFRKRGFQIPSTIRPNQTCRSCCFRTPFAHEINNKHCTRCGTRPRTVQLTWNFTHVLTHLPLDKMVSQTTFLDALPCMKSFVFWLKFHWICSHESKWQ